MTDTNTTNDRPSGEDYQNTVVVCSDCQEAVVVTEPDEPQELDEQVTFECGCPDKIGKIAAVKPDSWGVQFL